MEQDQLERWSEYFDEILNRPQPTIVQSPPTPKATPKIDEKSINEIKLAILNRKELTNLLDLIALLLRCLS
jgi:hypothetical protein